MQLRIEALEPTDRFESDLRALDAGTVAAVAAALQRLRENPRAKSLRCHTLKGGGKPTIYKIDATTNHSHQVTFYLDGTTAVLLRVGTHKELDREPT